MRSGLTCFAALLTLAIAEPASAAWYQAKTTHFVIYSDDDPGRLRDFATRLERFDKAVRTVRKMDDPPLTDSGRLTVYALRSTDAVGALVGNSGVAGLYRESAAGSVAFVPRRSGGDKFDLDAESIFFHEYAHHLQLQYSAMALPMWLTEGFAEFFATAEIKEDGSVLMGSAPLYRGQSLYDDNSGLALEEMVGERFNRLNAVQVDRLYGMGWLLTHYLTFEKSRAGQLERYVRAIQSGLAPLAAAKSAFGDLGKLKHELEKYKNAPLPGLRVDPKYLVIAPIDVQPLAPGEAAMMNVRIQSDRGSSGKAAAIAADARKIAASYPGNAAVQTELAQAELNAKDYAAAARAAEIALAADPTSVHASIYKGRAQMELAKADPQHANWEAIRQWFVKANRIDTENAEPLMLFYDSFRAAGQNAPPDAVKGLLYAVDLAPRDQNLRKRAVRELLSEGRLAEAKEMFTPLAFRPHATAKTRDFNERIMAAMSNGDGPAALKIINEEENADNQDGTGS